MDTHFDVIVVGSGFGGSVAAFRLSQGGKRVCVLERGKSYPPGSFPRRPLEMASNVWDPSAGHHGLYNIWSFDNFDAVVASGLGGGSLIYANVLLRKDEGWFRQRTLDDSGYEDWPVTRADLEPHYNAVEAMLAAQPFPYDPPGYREVAKTRAMRDAAMKLGLEWGLPKLAISFANVSSPPLPGEPLEPGPYPNFHRKPRFTCRLCGECVIGCNEGSKNTLDHTYLSAAASFGAVISTRSEVRVIARADDRYEVGYVQHPQENEGHPTETSLLPVKFLTADLLVMAAGALGTPYLLLRNRKSLPCLGPALGSRFSGNGDAVSFAVGARRDGSPLVLNPSHGPVITSYIRIPDEVDPAGAGPGCYIEDAGYPTFVDWLVEGSRIPGILSRSIRFLLRRFKSRFTHFRESDIGSEIARLLGDARLSACSLPLLGMGRDVPDGTMSLRGNFLAIDWSLKRSQDYYRRLETSMREIANAMGAKFRRNPLTMLNRMITVHPLGGCPMGTDQKLSVVNAYGEAFGCPGLYIADGSVMPGPIGPNPALTIAAFADRVCDHILEQRVGSARTNRLYSAKI